MAKDYSKYYTPLEVSSALVKLIDFKDYSSVVDICCGSGNLLKAARDVNATLNCYGVDIIDVSIDCGATAKSDGREYALNHTEKFDYALANPPFGRRESKKYTNRLFRGKYKHITSSRLEIEMLLANLRVLKQSGILLIILPSTIVEGTSAINTRKVLATNHFISAIIDLPLSAFFPERIKCSALIIEKSSPKEEPTILYKMDSSYIIKETKRISATEMQSGNWSKKYSTDTLGFTIHQGKVSTPSFCSNGEEVLHTGKRSNEWTPSIRFANIPEGKGWPQAEDGDIIISRIGASAGQMCIYHGSPKYISDCLLIVKSPNKILLERILNLDLAVLVSGLSTPHITVQSIYQLYSKIYNNTDS